MKKIAFLFFLWVTLFSGFLPVLEASPANCSTLFPPPAAPNFTVTTSDGQIKNLYQDYINQQKLMVLEAFFTTCPPCAAHAPLVQNLYTQMLTAYPGQIEFMLLSTLSTDTNIKVAQYKTNKGLTMPGVGKDGGSLTALQPYLNGQFGPFEGTPTFIVIAPGSGAVYFDIRGLTPSETITLLQQKIAELIPKSCGVVDYFNNPLDQVTMHVTSPAFDTSFLCNGTYDLSSITPIHNSSYTLRPHKGGNALDGLTTYDLVLISKHILATQPFLCPWQIIAADLNCSGSVTTFDIVTGRKLILGIIDTLPCGTWRFVPDSAASANGNCQEFKGVKLGDVTAGACNDSLSNGVSHNRSPLPVYFRDQWLSPGSSASVSFYFAEPAALDGLQFGLEYDPGLLTVRHIGSASLHDFEEDSYRLDADRLALSWIAPHGQQFMPDLPVFTLDISAPGGGRLSELLHLSSGGLAPEVYPSEGGVRSMGLEVLPAIKNQSVAPNPAKGHFSLYKNVDHEGDILVQLMDVQGKIVFAQTVTAQKGDNAWDLQMPAGLSGLFVIKADGAVAGKIILE